MYLLINKEILLNNNEAYRYYRYLNLDSASIHLAEINLYKKNMQYKSKVYGDVFGYNSDSTLVDESFYSAFDGSIETNFNAPPNSWLGIDAGESVKIESIEIIARNHFNIIVPGDIYELFFFDKGWISVGKKKAKFHHINFYNIPSNTLYLLSNITHGSEERIFKYEEGKQFFK